MQASRTLTAVLAASLLAVLPPGSNQARAADSNAAQAVDARAPDVLIREVSQQALTALRNNPSVKAGDIARINKLIDDLITPVADFGRTTQVTVGRYWREATPEQKQQLERQFRDLLILIYAGGLRNFGDQQIQFRPYRPGPDTDDAVVRSFVINKGQPVQVDYRLYKGSAGWKIYDVNVAGLWLTEAYRNQFKPILDQGGVAGLLKALTEKNAALEKNRSSGG